MGKQHDDDDDGEGGEGGALLSVFEPVFGARRGQIASGGHSAADVRRALEARQRHQGPSTPGNLATQFHVGRVDDTGSVALPVLPDVVGGVWYSDVAYLPDPDDPSAFRGAMSAHEAPEPTAALFPLATPDGAEEGRYAVFSLNAVGTWAPVACFRGHSYAGDQLLNGHTMYFVLTRTRPYGSDVLRVQACDVQDLQRLPGFEVGQVRPPFLKVVATPWHAQGVVDDSHDAPGEGDSGE